MTRASPNSVTVCLLWDSRGLVSFWKSLAARVTSFSKSRWRQKYSFAFRFVSPAPRLFRYGFLGNAGKRCSAARHAVSCGDARFCPHTRTFLLRAGESFLWEGFESKEPASGNSVLLGHDVVEDGVDGGAKVEEDKGHQVAVLADHCYLQGSGFKGFGK